MSIVTAHPRAAPTSFSSALLSLVIALVIVVLFAITGAFAQAPSQSTQQSPLDGGASAFSPKTLLAALSAPLDAPAQETLHRQVIKFFGHAALVKNRAAAKVEGTTAAWAVLATQPASIVREDGKLLGEMTQIGADGLQVLALEFPNFSETTYRIQVAGRIQQGGQVRIEHFEPAAESLANPNIPQGRLQRFDWTESKVFPKTARQVTVYTPANLRSGQLCGLMVWQDGTRHADRNGALRVPIVFDHLIHSGDMPPVIGVFIDPGRRPNQKQGEKAFNRSLEYDSLGDAYSRLLLEEILPEVRRRFDLDWSALPEHAAIAGGSSGGICAFTAAWERPDHFRKVLSWVGSFVDLRGGHSYPSLIRMTEPKPLRIYLLGGENDLDNPFGHWPTANKLMASALSYQGYDHHLEWTPCFHGTKGMAPKLPDALRWLWRDWKATGLLSGTHSK
jgi:enterochelin esterase-like enzyme